MAILRLLTDENISPRLVWALRDARHHVLDVKENRRFGWSDDRVLTWATAERCVVLTHDKDFAGLLKSPMRRSHAGVMLLCLRDQRPDHIAAKLLPLLTRLRARRLRNALILLGDESIEYLRS